MTYGVIGSGSFGTAVANILAQNGDVLIYTRRQEVHDAIKIERFNRKQKVHERVIPTLNLQDVCEQCKLIFPIVPSANFRAMMKTAAPYLQADHILIHGTKGLNVQLPPNGDKNVVRGKYIKTMTDIILSESIVRRVGCLSGPNLSAELAKGQPAATVVASRFNEVIEAGKQALKTPRFRVYGASDVRGIELAGVLKNMMAIASGILHGMGWGENAKAMLITRGLREMVILGKALGADIRAFFGLAGIGDLIATCLSVLSRNFKVGYRLAQGESIEQILSNMNEVAEGVKTVKIAKNLSNYYGLELPIADALYDILYNHQPIQTSIAKLMQHEFDVDADFW